VETQGPNKSYSIWWFLAGFVALGSIGLYLVITVGSADRTPARQVDLGPPTTSPSATSTTVKVPATFLDGTPVPEEIEEVVAEPGRALYLFSLPDGFTDQPTNSVVAPTFVEVSDDGTAITVAMACAVTADSVAGGILVEEDPFEVNIEAVAIGPSTGLPCPPSTELAKVTIPLEQPVGSRRVALAKVGDPVTLNGVG